MANHILKFYIKPEDIKNKIFPECKDIKILSTNLCSNGVIDIECIVSDDKITIHDNIRFALFSNGSIPLDKI